MIQHKPEEMGTKERPLCFPVLLPEAPGLSTELFALKKEEKSCARIFWSPSDGSSTSRSSAGGGGYRRWDSTL